MSASSQRIRVNKMSSLTISTMTTASSSQSRRDQGSTMTWLSTSQGSRSSTEISTKTDPTAVTSPFVRKLRRSFTRRTPQKFNRSSEYSKQRALTVTTSRSNSDFSRRNLGSNGNSIDSSIGSSKSNISSNSDYNSVSIGYNTAFYNSVSIGSESTTSSNSNNISIGNSSITSNSSSSTVSSSAVSSCTDNCNNKTSYDGINATATRSSISSTFANSNTSVGSSVAINALQTKDYSSVTHSTTASADISAQRSVSNDPSRHQTQTIWSKSSNVASTTADAFSHSGAVSPYAPPQLWRRRTSRDPRRNSVDATDSVVQASSIDPVTMPHSFFAAGGKASEEAKTEQTMTQLEEVEHHSSSSSPSVDLVDKLRTSLTSSDETKTSPVSQKTFSRHPDVKQTQKAAQILNETSTISLTTDLMTFAGSTESSNGSSPERPAAECCSKFDSTLAAAAGAVHHLDATTSVGPPETVYLDEIPSNDLVGRAATGSVSGEIVAVSIGCILVFWIILGPVAFAIYRSRENAKKTRRVKDKNASAAAVLEEIIRVELAKGRSRLYRTAVGDERELERLSLDDYGGPANWQHHVELPSSHSLLRAACLDSPSSSRPFDSLPFRGGILANQHLAEEVKGEMPPPVRGSYDGDTGTPELANGKATYEGFSYNGAFVMGTEPRSRRYSTATSRLPAMGSSASLQRRALHNLSSPTGEVGSGHHVTTSASVNHLALLRHGPLEQHGVIGVIEKPSSPEGSLPPSNQFSTRMVVSPITGHFPDKPRFPIMGQASLVHGTGSHKVLLSHDRGCNSDALHRRTTTMTQRNRVTTAGGTPTIGGSFGSPTQENEGGDVWMYHHPMIQDLTKTAYKRREERDCLHELEDSAV